jgi:hypothetical protein
MTIPDWRLCANRPAAAVRIANIEAYVQGAPRHDAAPIDWYFTTTTTMLQAAQPSLLAAHPAIGALLMVGFVSATENYFRDVFARIVAVCPIAQEVAGQEKISLGTVIWHRGKVPERGAFEHLSFTSAENVRTTAKKFAAHELQKNGALEAALVEFEKICELRHGVVHSGGVVAGKNALRLQLRRAVPESTIAVGFAELQECADVCSTVVASANAELFASLMRRWALDWRRHQSWDATKANARFRELWRVFHSTFDAKNKQIPVVVSARKCQDLVRSEFKI